MSNDPFYSQIEMIDLSGAETNYKGNGDPNLYSYPNNESKFSIQEALSSFSKNIPCKNILLGYEGIESTNALVLQALSKPSSKILLLEENNIIENYFNSISRDIIKTEIAQIENYKDSVLYLDLNQYKCSNFIDLCRIANIKNIQIVLSVRGSEFDRYIKLDDTDNVENKFANLTIIRRLPESLEGKGYTRSWIISNSRTLNIIKEYKVRDEPLMMINLLNNVINKKPVITDISNLSNEEISFRLTKLIVKLENLYNPSILKENIFLAPSTTTNLLKTVIRALLHQDDTMLVESMSWPMYPKIINSIERKYEVIDSSQTGLINPVNLSNLLKDDGKIKLLLISMPNNPSGAVYDIDTLYCLAKIASNQNVKLVIDQAYRGTQDKNALLDASILLTEKHLDNVVLVNSTTKTYGLKGLRSSWAIANPEIINQLRKTEIDVSSPIYKKVLLNALEISSIPDFTLLERARKLLIQIVKESTNLSIVGNPQGSVTALIRLPDNVDNIKFVTLLAKYGLIVDSGNIFGAPGKIRVSYSYVKDNITTKHFINAIRTIDRVTII